VQELQNLIRQYELGKVDPLLNREVHQIGKKRRTNKELHSNAQIGEYDIDYVVLNLGSEVNVMMKPTWVFAPNSSLCEQIMSAYMPSWALLGMTAVR
jgi:hypothetical protein